MALSEENTPLSAIVAVLCGIAANSFDTEGNNDTFFLLSNFNSSHH